MKRLLLLLALATPASAQVTNCQIYPNALSCQSTRQGSGVDWSAAQPRQSLDVSAITRAQQAKRRAQMEAQQRADAALVQARAQTAGRLVAQGKCVEAREIALKAGDFALAQEVANACK